MFLKQRCASGQRRKGLSKRAKRHAQADLQRTHLVSRGVEFRVSSMGVGIWGLKFGVSGSAQESGSEFKVWDKVLHSGFWVKRRKERHTKASLRAVSPRRLSGFSVFDSHLGSTVKTLKREERCPPRQKTRVERLKAKVKPLLTKKTKDFEGWVQTRASLLSVASPKVRLSASSSASSSSIRASASPWVCGCALGQIGTFGPVLA